VSAGRQTAELLLRVAEERLERAVHGHDRAVCSEQHRRRRRRLEHRSEALLALAQQRHRRKRAVRERKRRDQDGKKPRVEDREGAHGDPEAREDELDPEARRREQPARAEAVAPAESKHRREEAVIDEDECDHGRETRKCEASIAGAADRLGREPRCEAAQRIVRDVEEADVPRVPAVDPLRDHHRHDDPEHEWCGQDERSRDDEGRGGVQAVVPADRDPEDGRDGGEGEDDREDGPLVARRRLREAGDGGDGDESQRLGQTGVEGRRSGQLAHTPGLPAHLFGHCWNAHLLPHLVKVTG
jgi:hypothetical protein